MQHCEVIILQDSQISVSQTVNTVNQMKHKRPELVLSEVGGTLKRTYNPTA